MFSQAPGASRSQHRLSFSSVPRHRYHLDNTVMQDEVKCKVLEVQAINLTVDRAALSSFFVDVRWVSTRALFGRVPLG